MRASRLLSILIVLQTRGRLSSVALARELEVSERTIYRYVDELSAAGVPIFAERGRNGGFALLDGYRTEVTGLTSTEVDAISLIGVAQAAKDLGLGEEAAAARQKIFASLPKEKGSIADRIAARFHVDAVPWYSHHTPPTALRPIASAVWADKQVRMTYQSWQRVVVRTISPLGIVMKAGAWYVVGAIGKEVRTYRVDSIRDFEITTKAASRPRTFDLARYWDQAAKEFESRLRSETARVRLSPRGMEILRALNPTAAALVVTQKIMPSKDGWVETDITVEQLPGAVNEVLRFGAELEVLEPVELRTAVATEAKRISRLHENRTRPTKRK